MLSEKFKNTKIFLASKSPRRKQLLEGLGVSFETIIKEGIDETIPTGLNNKDAAVYLARHKAKAYNEYISENTILITADTIVCLKGKILTKPTDSNDAFRILQQLSGKKHKVITGVCIKTLDKETAFSETTDVYFNKLSATEINYYIKKFKPYDKAGAYGIQEWIGYAGIKKIKGSYYNVMGLPVQKIYKILKKTEIIKN